MGIDGAEITFADSALGETFFRLERVTLLQVSCSTPTKFNETVDQLAPMEIDIAVETRNRRLILASGTIRSKSINVPDSIHWAGELGLPKESRLSIRGRNDTGASQVVEAVWAWR